MFIFMDLAGWLKGHHNTGTLHLSALRSITSSKTPCYVLLQYYVVVLVLVERASAEAAEAAGWN